MAREKITEQVMPDGNIKVTVVFLAYPRETAPLSASGKQLNGYAEGFKTTDSGAKLNIVYGYSISAPKAVAPANTQEIPAGKPKAELSL